MSTEASRRQRRVLVVDDDPVARMLVSSALTEVGFVAEEAADGREALARIEAELPDLAIIDLEMPHLDGFETCEAIRASDRTRELPVLIATGFTDSATIDRAYDAGATDYLKKPIDLSILRHHVRFVLRAHDAFVDLRRTLSELEASDRRLEGAQKLAHLGNWELNPDGEMLWSTETFRILGLEPHAEQPTLDAFLKRIHADDRAGVEKLLQSAAVTGEAWSLDHRIRTGLDEIRVVKQNATVSTETTGACVSGTIQDITERRRAEEQIELLAHFDSLTALPNRKLLSERLDRHLGRAGHANELVGVIRLDLDRFRRVNDTLGQDVGDDLLRAVARRLQSCVRPTDFVAQTKDEEPTVSSLGGDEFSIILSRIQTTEDISFVARRILDSFQRPFVIHDHEIEMSASLGAATFPKDGGDTATLLRNSGTALNDAKRNGGAALHFFGDDMNERAARQMQIEMGLASAVDRGELRLVYQPKWDAQTRRVVGMEALLRWRSEALGDVSPGEFIPIAEKSNLIQRLGEWVFRESCRQLSEWQSQGLEPVPVAVNFSSHQLRTAAVSGVVTGVMRDHGVDPSLIEIEVTESALIGDLENVMLVLQSLKGTGVRIALDDFGTGYSSISHLARFPIDVLKIDQSFVSAIGEDDQATILVSALIALAGRLSLTVVAEGVETEAQASYLAEQGCDVLQGFGLARPLEVEAISDLLESERAKA